MLVSPALLHRLNGLLLALLGAAAKQNYQAITVFAEIDPVAWSNIDFPFKYACPDAVHVRPVACRELIQCRRNLCRCNGIEPIKARGEGERACGSRYSSTRTSDI